MSSVKPWLESWDEDRKVTSRLIEWNCDIFAFKGGISSTTCSAVIINCSGFEEVILGTGQRYSTRRFTKVVIIGLEKYNHGDDLRKPVEPNGAWAGLAREPPGSQTRWRRSVFPGGPSKAKSLGLGEEAENGAETKREQFYRELQSREPIAATSGLSVRGGVIIARRQYAFGRVFVEGVGWKNCRARDLAAMARTCCVFSARATDVLWARLDGLTPLLIRLPDDLISKRREAPQYLARPPLRSEDLVGTRRTQFSKPTRFFELQRPFGDDDWNTFFKIAARVVELHFIRETDVQIHPDIYSALCCAPSKSLFPKLQILHWPEYKNIFFLKRLLGPTVLDLSLSEGPDDDGSLETVEAMGELCPNVKTFSWHCDFPSEEQRDALSRAIFRWRNVETLECFDVDDTTLKHLMSLESLRHLNMSIRTTRSYAIAHRRITNPFPKVVSLSFSSPPTCTLSSVAALVSALHPCRASPREFTASTKDAYANSLKDLIDVMPSSFHGDILVQVNINEDDEWAYHSLDLSTLQPLFSFHNLSVINISSGRTVIMDDNELIQLGDAWPKLISLSINKKYGWGKSSETSSTLTLQGVRAMLKKFPMLQTLALAVNGNSVSNALSRGSYGSFSIERPFRLDLLNSRISTSYIPAVAAVLADIFPNSDARVTVHAWTQMFEVDTDAEQWGEVDPVELYRERWTSVVDTMDIINRVKRLEKRLISV
ncbi:hypothetical protein CONPUDRAFT_68692 [Coniophora puteana RWD-64-598 SS2]|uniref:RNI-like protein n=1 Tax=Coniophora puteana (strain RWD-64-598) TaxID=741705 RepID=A0A5M3N3U4_CONPW|nr:uncharacterized protein CONPUDRAFT_68692 [Coniophora puteana RWD-64-598 SS2]EIW86082.1 hypothetical protein CONPUDRAFT_68692 [Coniophora puteana RWD-64-598 SS2]